MWKRVIKIFATIGAIITLYGGISLISLVLVSLTNDETDRYGTRCVLAVDEQVLEPLLSQSEIKESNTTIRCNTIFLTIQMKEDYSPSAERGFLVRLAQIRLLQGISYPIDVCITGESPIFAKLLDDGSVSYVGTY